MAEKIHIHSEKAKEDAAQIENAAAHLKSIPLTCQDSRTTILANTNCKNTYGRSQERIAELGILLDQEAKNIRSLNVAFTEFDEMIGNLEKMKNR